MRRAVASVKVNHAKKSFDTVLVSFCFCACCCGVMRRLFSVCWVWQCTNPRTVIFKSSGTLTHGPTYWPKIVTSVKVLARFRGSLASSSILWREKALFWRRTESLLRAFWREINLRTHSPVAALDRLRLCSGGVSAKWLTGVVTTRESSPESSPIESWDSAEDFVCTNDGAKLKDDLVVSLGGVFLTGLVSSPSFLSIGDRSEFLIFLLRWKVGFSTCLIVSFLSCCDGFWNENLVAAISADDFANWRNGFLAVELESLFCTLFAPRRQWVGLGTWKRN